MLDVAHSDHQALIHKIKERDEEGATAIISKHIEGALETLTTEYSTK